MPWSFVEVYALFPAFLLVLFRVSGLMLAAPFFSGAIVPLRFKVLLSAAISLAVFPMVAGSLIVPVTMNSALVGLLGELMIGLFVGFGASMIFMGVQLAAELVSRQSGMMLGSVYNPMMEGTGSTMTQLYYMVALMVFLAMGGHRALVRTVLDSFTTIPPLGFRVTEELGELLVSLLTVSFELGIRVGGPILVALMLTLLTLGFLSRTMPQLNILTIGFPIKLSVALLVMALTIQSMESVLLDTFALGIDGVRAGLGLEPLSG